MTEKDSHRKAFETYFEMGNARSLAKLAHKLGVSRGTVRNWSSAFHWQERIEEREREIAQAVSSRSVRSGIEAGEHKRKLVQLAYVQIAKQLAEGKVRATIADLDKIMRLEAFLEGAVESREEIITRDLRGRTDAELREMLRLEIEDLRRLGYTGPEVEN